MFTRRKFVNHASAAAIGVIAAPLIKTNSYAATADHVLTFGHTFGKATENVMITGLDLFKKRAEEYSEGKLLVDIHEAGRGSIRGRRLPATDTPALHQHCGLAGWR